MPIVPIAAVSLCNYPWDNLTKLTFPFATMAFDDSLLFFHRGACNENVNDEM